MIFSVVICAVVLVALADSATIPGSQKCEPSKVPYTLPHPEQCDAFFRCEDGILSEQLCEDGLVYHPKDKLCDIPQRVDCTGRSKLQPPKGSGNCPRLNGLFRHPQFCDQYFFCQVGIPMLITCPVGLVYDLKAAVCEFPDVALRPGCMPEEVLKFRCPSIQNTTTLVFGDHLRFPKEDDCRFFFKCLKNGYPRLGGCEMGRVYNALTGFCDRPKNVKNCENYYNHDNEDILDDEEAVAPVAKRLRP